MKFTKPAANQAFAISTAPAWPSIAFETDAQGAHTWNWTLAWGTFKKSGSEKTAGNTWDAAQAIANCGGALTVVATAGTATASITVQIKGTNPSAAEVTQYLDTKPDSAGFAKIINHETKFQHFHKNTSEPVKSFDNGYGLCQLTTPPPTFEQAWNWKQNVDGGLKLFGQKRTAARTYLSQSGRTFSDEQLKFETVCRWNGGAYHKWDAAAGKWVRSPNVLCDTKTGNIGWDMTDPENTGKTEAQLRARDQASYRNPPGAHWKYFGVCYADRVLT